MDNERYFREHPELQALIQLFTRKLLADKPTEVLHFAGKFFDNASLSNVVMKASEEEKANEERNKWLNDLIKGKTLIE